MIIGVIAAYYRYGICSKLKHASPHVNILSHKLRSEVLNWMSFQAKTYHAYGTH